MLTLTRSTSSKLPKKNFYTSILANTQQINNGKTTNSEIKFPHKPFHKRDMRNEVPIKHLVYKNENQTTIAKNYSKKEEGDDNFASYFFLNSCKRFDKDYTKEVREKLIEEYNKENPNAYDIAKLMLGKYIMDKLKEYQNLEKNKSAAKTRVTRKKNSDKNVINEENNKQKEEVKRLYHSMKKVIEHILDQEGEKKFERMEKKLQEKESISLEIFKKKNTDIMTKVDLLGKLRLLMSKKTDEMNIFKEIESSLRLDSSSEIVKEFREYSESNLDLSVASSRVSSRLSKFTEEIKRQREKEEEKKIQKYFNLHKLKEKWKVEDKTKVQQIIRRALIRDTLQENERIRIKGNERIEKKKEAKVEELKNTMGISTFAITKKDVEQAKTQLSLKSPQKTEKPEINLKISQKKPRDLALKTQDLFASINKNTQIINSNTKTSERTRTSEKEQKNEKKDWKTNMQQKNTKENKIKSEFFRANDELNKGTFFQKTLSYSSLFNKKLERHFAA